MAERGSRKTLGLCTLLLGSLIAWWDLVEANQGYLHDVRGYRLLYAGNANSLASSLRRKTPARSEVIQWMDAHVCKAYSRAHQLRSKLVAVISAI